MIFVCCLCVLLYVVGLVVCLGNRCLIVCVDFALLSALFAWVDSVVLYIECCLFLVLCLLLYFDCL